MIKNPNLASTLGILTGINLIYPVIAQAESALFLAYPPNNHQTTAPQIFFIGSANPEGEVLVNGKAIERSKLGYFAPSFPLEMGDNLFTFKYKNQEVKVKITRVSTEPKLPASIGFIQESLTPNTNISRLPGELICFGAIASPNATVTVKLADRTIPLLSPKEAIQLPDNSAILIANNQPKLSSNVGKYEGCTEFSQVGNLGHPSFELSLNGQTISQKTTGTIEVINPTQLEIIEVTALEGVTRTGPSTDYSRLTPLPKGTKARVTGKEGEWLRLDYGAWIKQSETIPVVGNMPPRSIVRSISSRQVNGTTEIIFPLEFPVPFTIDQGDRVFSLTLHNTVAQTDTIRLDDDPIIKRLDWQQITPDRVQYRFNLKIDQQWGYDTRYEGTTLILSLRHPPLKEQNKDSLRGIKILLDPGHGGNENGAIGPNGTPEKELTLRVSKLLQEQLLKKGATVYLTRETDKDVSLPERTSTIDQLKPDIALSIHYNALPDGGDAIKTMGIGSFWYHSQAHSLAVFLHNYLVEKLARPSYGVFWNNLALTRPHTVPSVLLELGFIINPTEFEWITNQEEQQKLAQVLAEGISQWFIEVSN